MGDHFWEGKKIRLRAIESCDWELFHQNDYDSEAARLSDVIYPPRSSEAAQKWAEKQSEREVEDHEMMLAIETLDEELVGTIAAFNCNRTSGFFYYGLAIFRDHWRKGYATEAISIFLKYFFEECRYQKVNAFVYEFNEASIHLHKKLGFKCEGRLRRTYFTKGQYFDEFIFGLTVEEFYEKIFDQ